MRLRWLSLSATLALAACGGSESRSIVVVKLAVATARPDATSATITVDKTKRTFKLTGLDASTAALGVFLDGAPSGMLQVMAEVTAGGSCNKLLGGGQVMLNGKKGEKADVTVTVTCQVVVPPLPDAGPDAPGSDAKPPDTGTGPDTTTPPPDGGGMTDAGVPDAPMNMDMVMPPADMGPPPPPPLTTLGNCSEVDHGIQPSAMCNPNLFPLDQVLVVAFSPDGNLAATAGTDGRVKFWKVANGKLEADSRPALSNPSSVQPRIAFSADGTLMANSANEGELQLYSIADRTQTPMMATTPAARIRGVAFLGDSSRLVTVDRTAVVKVWDVPNKRELSAHKLFDAVTEPWSLAITAGSNASAIWAAVGLAKVPDSVPPEMGMGLPRDGAYVWFGNLGNPAQASVLKAAGDEVNTTAISPDGRWLVAGGDTSEAGVWDIQAPATPMRASTLPAVRDSAMNDIDLQGLAFDAMGRTLAAAYGGFNVGGGIRMFTPGTWAVQAQRFQMDTYYPVSVAVRPQGNVLVAGETACLVVLVCGD